MLNIVQDRCQPTRHSKAACRLCVQACPVEGCLSFDNNALSVKKDLCPGCGICTTVCPTGALTLAGLDDTELLVRLKDGLGKKNLFVGCYLAPVAEDRKTPEPFLPEYSSVSLPCLALLKESHLVALILSGVGKIDLDCSRCAGCSFHGGKGLIERTVRYADNLLARSGLSGRVEIMEVLPRVSKSAFGLFRKDKKNGARKIAHGAEYSRRELFTFLKGKAGALAEEKVLGRHIEREVVLDSGAMPQKRAILIEALRAAGAGALGRIKDGDFPIRQIGITEECVMCRRCDAFCPTGALRRVQGEGEASIEFRAALCMGCHQCKEFCPAGALFYEQEVDLGSLAGNEVRVIMKRQTVICPRCSKSFMPETDVGGCPECRKKKKLEDNILSVIFSKPDMKKRVGKETV